jgi:hypothetical protein
MVYEFKTKLTPEEAIERAVKFFGPTAGGLGLEIKEQQGCYARLVGGGGHVAVSATVVEGKTTVEIETREWDLQAKQFMSRTAG